MPSRRTFICCCKLHSLRSHSPLGARVRLDVIMLGNLPRNHAAQEQLNLLEKSIYTRAIDPDLKVREKMENNIFFRSRTFYHSPIAGALGWEILRNQCQYTVYTACILGDAVYILSITNAYLIRWGG